MRNRLLVCFSCLAAVACGAAAPCPAAPAAAPTAPATLATPATPAAPATPAPLAAVEAFNQATIDATQRMDNDALLALWEDDGVTLLPGEAPVVGKPAIRAFVEKAMKSIPGAHMRSFELHCGGVEIAGDVATEYCDEHQVVDLPGKPPFDGRGKLLYVLHRGADGVFRLRREMWNQGGS